MKKNLLKYIVACFLCTGLVFSSCTDVNDWGVDESHSRMFRPVLFETVKVSGTSVDLRFADIPNAGSYVIEFSKDSLQFTNIVRTDVILPENLIREEGVTTKRYIQTFEELDSESRYSARIKVTSNSGIPDSEWVAVTFRTLGEQIVKSVTNITETTADLAWTPTPKVTHLRVIPNGGVASDITLSASNITDGTYNFTGLAPDTRYVVEIYNGLTKRGSAIFSTLQTAVGDGKRYDLIGGEDIVDFLANKTGTETAVLLVLHAGKSYTANWLNELAVAQTSLAIPARIKSLTIWGGSGPVQASINFTSIKLDASASSFKVKFYNMELKGNNSAADYMFNLTATENCVIPEFIIENSDVHTFRGLLRIQSTSTSVVNKYEIKNSLIHDLGSYGILAVEATNRSQVQNVSVSNSTIYEVGSGDLFAAKLGNPITSLVVTSCTFYDAPSASGKYFFNFNGAGNVPATFTVDNCILSASNAGNQIKGVNPKMTVSFVTGSYRTSDLNIGTGNPMLGVSDYPALSTEVFQDPANGDFKIKVRGIGGGTSQPGDPRWW